MDGPIIEVKGLVKTYGDENAVDRIDLSVAKGEVFSLLGPNGAGKTTTVEILETIRRRTSGHVSVLGMDVERNARDIKFRIGVLPQGFDALEMLTVKENIEYFGGMYPKSREADGLITLINLEDKADELFKNLSGGMKQRVGVAIALVNDPDIVFLDEPTTGLDPKARREVWSVISGLRDEGRTVILTTHYMDEAEVLADRLVIMNEGRIIARGTPEEVIAEHGKHAVVLIRGCGHEAMDALGDNGWDAELNGSEVRVTLSDDKALPRIIMRLEDAKVHYGEIIVKRSNLEDVFLNLTGGRIVGGELVEE